MRSYYLILSLLLAHTAGALDIVTALISVTNTPAGNSSNLTVNASTRYWTNDISSSPGTLILVTNNVPRSATNLWLHLGIYPQDARHIVTMTASNSVQIRGYPGEALTVSLAGNWGAVTYTTNQVTETWVVKVPYTSERLTNATNIASMLVNYLNIATNSIQTNTTLASLIMSQSLTNAVVIGNKVWTGTNDFSAGSITNYYIISSPGMSGILTQLTNGYWTNGYAENLTVTNLSVPGSGTNSISIGAGSTATADNSMAVGNSASSTNTDSVAIGNTTKAGGVNSVALGNNADALSESSTAIGDGSSVDFNATYGTAIGAMSSVSLDSPKGTAIGYFAIVESNATNAVAIGANAYATKNGSIVLGTSSSLVTSPGRFEDIMVTNMVLKGTNLFYGVRITPFNAVSTLSDNQTNTVVPGTNTIIRLHTFATTQFGIGSIQAPGVDGWRCEILNDTGYPMNIVNQWGLEGTATYRIKTGTAADVAITNNPGYAHFIYDGNSSRWLLLNKSN